MGKRPTRNMMGRRYLMLTLVAVFCTAVPTTDLVIPEKIDFAAYSTSTSFLQAMSKSGGTEADCRTFATTTIDTIRTDVKSEQGILNAKDTGEDCADKGQDVVANAQGKLDAADKDQLAKQGVAATRLNAKKTACTASVAFNVNLDTLESKEGYDSTKEQSYMGAKSTCTSATSAMTKADKAVTTAKITVKDSQREHDDALAQAAQLKSACHCRVQGDQAVAWTAASTATAAHAADWKQAHEVICALDKKIPCEKVPDCPALEQVTLSKDISSEECTHAPTDAPTAEPTTAPPTENTGSSYTNKKAGGFCYTGANNLAKVERSAKTAAACQKFCDETTAQKCIAFNFSSEKVTCYIMAAGKSFTFLDGNSRHYKRHISYDCYIRQV